MPKNLADPGKVLGECVSLGQDILSARLATELPGPWAKSRRICDRLIQAEVLRELQMDLSVRTHRAHFPVNPLSASSGHL